jgi:hypothetical protein
MEYIKIRKLIDTSVINEHACIMCRYVKVKFSRCRPEQALGDPVG